jgi:hypothetical protein
MTAHLIEIEREQEAAVGALAAVAAANGILKEREAFDVGPAETRKTKLRSITVRADHAGLTETGYRRNDRRVVGVPAAILLSVY